MTRNDLLNHKELCTLEQIRKALDEIDANDNGEGFYDKDTEIEGGGTNSYDRPMLFIRLLDEKKSVYADYEDGFGFCDIDNGDLNGDADFDEEPSLEEIHGLLILDNWIKERIAQ